MTAPPPLSERLDPPLNGCCLSETCLQNLKVNSHNFPHNNIISCLLAGHKIKAYRINMKCSQCLPYLCNYFCFSQVYHHASILLLSDYAYHFTPWPAIGVMLGMNSFVHVFLYFYYGQSALYPTQRPQWRKTLTQLQMFQFVVGIVHSSFGYAHHGFCIFSIFYGFTMLALFGNFYFHAYIKARHDKKSE